MLTEAEHAFFKDICSMEAELRKLKGLTTWRWCSCNLRQHSWTQSLCVSYKFRSSRIHCCGVVSAGHQLSVESPVHLDTLLFEDAEMRGCDAWCIYLRSKNAWTCIFGALLMLSTTKIYFMVQGAVAARSLRRTREGWWEGNWCEVGWWDQCNSSPGRSSILVGSFLQSAENHMVVELSPGIFLVFSASITTMFSASPAHRIVRLLGVDFFVCFFRHSQRAEEK